MKPAYPKILLMLFGILISGHVNAEESISKREGSLECGVARWQSATTYFSPVDIDRQPLHQEISVFPDASSQGKAVRLDGRLVRKSFVKGQKVLDGSVTAWGCIESAKGKQYVMLWYTCSWGDERGNCAGRDKEWVRLFSPDGKPMNANYRRIDQRYSVLVQKLGLSTILEEGPELQEIGDFTAPDRKSE